MPAKRTVLRPQGLLILGSLLGTTFLLFQNCAGGFKAVSSAEVTNSSVDGANSNGQGVNLGSVLEAQDGKVFLQDPISDSKQMSLPITTDFSPFQSAVGLPHLLSQPYLADGAFFVKADDAITSSGATPGASLAFPFGDLRSEQVNAYYHIDKFVNNLGEQSLFPAANIGVSVNAHCKIGTNSNNNAYFDPTYRELCLGYSKIGTQTIWAADDADVIVHEYGHSINHNISTTTIFNSTTDTRALDEAFADLWAFSENRQLGLAKWFGNAIFLSQGSTTNNFTGIRDLGSQPQHPSAIVGEMHGDSIFFSSTVADVVNLANPALSPNQIRSLLHSLVGDLQNNDTLSDMIINLKTEAKPLGIDSSVIDAALRKRNLLRKDAVSGLKLSTTKPVYVIDNHRLSTLLSGGNCNGQLDRGETVFLLPNLVNVSSADVGTLRWKLTTTADPAAVKILPGGETGTLAKISAGKGFVDFLQTLVAGSSSYGSNLGYAALAVQASATATGTVSFNLKVTGFNTLDANENSVNLPFTLTVGSAPNQTTCTNDSGVLP